MYQSMNNHFNQKFQIYQTKKANIKASLRPQLWLLYFHKFLK